MSEYDYDPLPCEWCRQEVDTSKGLHECRQIDLLKRIDDLEEAFRFIKSMPFPYLDPDGNNCYVDVVRMWCKGMTEGLEAQGE